MKIYRGHFYIFVAPPGIFVTYLSSEILIPFPSKNNLANMPLIKAMLWS